VARLGFGPKRKERFDWTLDDPELISRFTAAGWISTGGTGLPSVSEADALTIPAYSRGESLIAGTIAGLPLKAYEKVGDTRQETPSVLDHPQGPATISRFAWVETLLTYLVRYSEAYLRPITNGADALVGLEIVHPGSVTKVEQAGWGKLVTIKMADKTETVLDTRDGTIVQILAPGMVGLRGVPIYQWSKPLFQVAIAAMNSSGRVFTGPMVSGLVTPDGEDEIEGTEMELIMEKLNARISGTTNAGRLAAVNKHLKITPWQQTNADAQFSETLTSITEAFARLLGLPPHLLAAIDKQTSWGTGIAEQNIGLARYCLMSYTSRIESALVPFLPDGVYAEFDYKGLLQGSPKEEIGLLLDQVAGGLLTEDEARALINRPPKPQDAPPVVAGETVQLQFDDFGNIAGWSTSAA
jgi:HK97 family phage portal protein